MLYIKRILLILCFSPVLLEAAEFYEPFQTTRQLGMGGVYVFNENDSNSFIQNPAYSCFTKGMNWSIANLNFGIGDLSNTEDIQQTLEEDTELTADNISDFYGKKVYVKTGGSTSFTLPCFGFGINHNVIASFLVENPAFPTIKTFYLTDTIVLIGGGFKFGEVFSFGADVKQIRRKGGPVTFGPDSISLLDEPDGFANMIKSAENGGSAYGVDIGITARVDASPMNPTFSMAWKDVGSTSFTKTTGNQSPERQKDNLVLGATFDQSFILFGIAGGIEYRHATDSSVQFGQKIHMGAELSLPMIDLRAGLHQGYPTYGAGIDLWLFTLDASLYSVETGFYPGQTPEQRAQITLSLDLSFDPNFNLMGSKGGQRRLKQRR